MRITRVRRTQRVMAVLTIGLFGALGGSACRSPGAASVRSATSVLTSATNRVPVTIGKVCRVRPELGYVVVECVSLPLPDEEVTVYRNGHAVARLRLTGPGRVPFWAADVLEGEPQVGDKVRTMRVKTSGKTERERP